MFNHFFNSLLRVFWKKIHFPSIFLKKIFLTRVYVQYKKYNKVYILLYMVQYKGHFLEHIYLIIKYLAFNLSLRVQLQPPPFAEMVAVSRRDGSIKIPHSPRVQQHQERWFQISAYRVLAGGILGLSLHSTWHESASYMTQASIIYDASKYHI